MEETYLVHLLQTPSASTTRTRTSSRKKKRISGIVLPFIRKADRAHQQEKKHRSISFPATPTTVVTLLLHWLFYHSAELPPPTSTPNVPRQLQHNQFQHEPSIINHQSFSTPYTTPKQYRYKRSFSCPPPPCVLAWSSLNHQHIAYCRNPPSSAKKNKKQTDSAGGPQLKYVIYASHATEGSISVL